MQQHTHTQPEPDAPHEPALARELTPGVTTNPQVMVGKPVIAGTRIPVERITGALFAGDTIDDIMYNYALTREQIRDALHYAHILVEAEGQRRIVEARRR